MINIFNKAVGWLRRGLYFTPRQVVCILIIILFLALAFRVLSWFAEPIISRDGIGYIEWAQALQNCDGDLDSLAQQYRAYKYSPLFISILALPIPGMTPHSIALMLNFFFGTALVLICFLLFKQVTNNNNIALAGTLIAAMHPTLINYSIEVQRECGYLFFTCLFFLFITKYMSSSLLIYCGMASISAVLAFFFRYEGVELFFFAGLAFCFTAYYNKWLRGWRLLNHILFFCGITVIAIVILLLSLQQPPSVWLYNSWNKLQNQILTQEK